VRMDVRQTELARVIGVMAEYSQYCTLRCLIKGSFDETASKAQKIVKFMYYLTVSGNIIPNTQQNYNE
jgi:hypothetical protein